MFMMGMGWVSGSPFVFWGGGWEEGGGGDEMRVRIERLMRWF